jgi:hypothetical protein
MKFRDSHLASLDLAKPEGIVLLVGYLRGDIIVTGDEEEEKSYLEDHGDCLQLVREIINANNLLNHAQLNELLLILNKNRISRGFLLSFSLMSKSSSRMNVLKSTRVNIQYPEINSEKVLSDFEGSRC